MIHPIVTITDLLNSFETAAFNNVELMINHDRPQIHNDHASRIVQQGLQETLDRDDDTLLLVLLLRNAIADIDRGLG